MRIFMLRNLGIAGLLLAAGCTQEASQTEVAADEAMSNESVGVAASNASVAAPTGVPLLDGEWQLSKIDGRPVDGAATVASFSGGKLRLAAGCNRRAWTFTQKRNIVA